MPQAPSPPQVVEEVNLSSWEEEYPKGNPIGRRAWKGFRFEALDALEAKYLGS